MPVCPPGTTTACTAYTYTSSGSHAPTSVRNADPTSYYRLNDPAAATAAANQLPVDDLTTVDPPATEMNTTPGVAGPVPGVTATSFNGTSSWIPLDGTWCPTPGQASSCFPMTDAGRVVSTASMAVSIWFKTTSASGILLGAGSDVPAGGVFGIATQFFRQDGSYITGSGIAINYVDAARGAWFAAAPAGGAR